MSSGLYNTLDIRLRELQRKSSEIAKNIAATEILKTQALAEEAYAERVKERNKYRNRGGIRSDAGHTSIDVAVLIGEDGLPHIRYTDQDDNTWKYEYNNNRDMTRKTTPEGNTWEYEYDTYGRMITNTNPEGEATHYE